VSIRGRFGVFWASLMILGLSPGMARSGDLVELVRWADEGALVRGKGMGDDVVRLIAEASWDRSASRDPARYFIRVAFPDGRVDTRPFPVDYPPGRSRFAVYVAAGPIRDVAPSMVKVAVTVVDASSGTPVGNTLTAGIEQFPRPKGDASASDPGPFGWGKPLEGPIRILPNPGPDGLRFARIAGPGGSPAFFIATTEATIGQVNQRLPGYDPKAGRSDEFALEDPTQPAINLKPAQARQYLDALGKADQAGVIYRFPTLPEWSEAARGGKASTFWWGEEPTFPAGANLLGPEPALPGDATAPSQPPEASPTFESNPFGLAHTFGNAAEWATDPAGGFARMGGHFRTEPASPLPLVKVDKEDDLGPDPFVGVRPVADLSPDAATALIRKQLSSDPRLAKASVAYDPDRGLATLTGPVDDPSARRSADDLLKGLWFVAAVDNKLDTSALAENQMAILGATTAPARRLAILDRTFVEVPLSIRWLDPLPVTGTAWWLNVYLPGGGHQATKLDPGEPGKSTKLVVRVDREKLAAQGLPDTSPSRVALSIGAPAPTLSDGRVVTNAVEVRPTFAPRPR
jgi:hypothetical protein